MNTRSIEYPPHQYPYRIKNWDKFQHFRDRRPIWIKLYRNLLDNRDWKLLDPMLAKTLVELWLLSSETGGYLPDIETISFRLRIEVKSCRQQISQLNQWIDCRDINLIPNPDQNDILEIETEKEKELLVHSRKIANVPPAYSDDFESFWAVYPKRDGSNPKHLAYKSYRAALKSGAEPAVLKKGASRLAQSFAGKLNGERRYVPQASTWLNQRRWEDDCEGPVNFQGGLIV